MAPAGLAPGAARPGGPAARSASGVGWQQGSAPVPVWDPARRPPPTWVARAEPPPPPTRVRPRYREPLPVRVSAVVLGGVITTIWFTLTAAMAASARAYVWWTLIAAALAWVSAVVLSRYGDRGSAAGVASVASLGLSVAAIVVIVRWAGGDWLLW